MPNPSLQPTCYGLRPSHAAELKRYSCLILGRGKEGRPIHVVCSPKDEFLVIITAYLPSTDEWDEDCKTRISR